MMASRQSYVCASWAEKREGSKHTAGLGSLMGRERWLFVLLCVLFSSALFVDGS